MAVDRGPCLAIAILACHLKGDESHQNFFRIYRQIPSSGSERLSLEQRREQASVDPGKHHELDALLSLWDCGFVP